MEPAPALTEPAAPAGARSAEPTALRPGPDAKNVSELRARCNELLKRLEAERARVAALLGEELVPAMTMARYLIEDAAQRVARGEFEDGAAAMQNASARISDAMERLKALCSELRPGVPQSGNDG